jgi:hypothetical protein
MINLKVALSGDAMEVVKCFKTIANNYEVAWDCLNKLYNKRVTVQSHTKAISELEGGGDHGRIIDEIATI